MASNKLYPDESNYFFSPEVGTGADYTGAANLGVNLARPIFPSQGAAPLVPVPYGQPTVTNPGPPTKWRGVYGNPRVNAQEAKANTAPESPNLKKIFGVTRRELSDVADRKLDPKEKYWSPAPKAKGSEHASRVITPRNTQRLVDTITELKKGAPDMYHGMKGWYVMDPAYKLLVQQIGPEAAAKEFKRLNAMSFFSPGSPVPLEINRGTAANMFDKRGIDWRDAGLKQEDMAKLGYPNVQGFMFHRKAQHDPHKEFIAGGMTPEAMGKAFSGNGPKVPLYYQSSLPPELGGQSRLPVPDAHFARDIGMPDVRPLKLNRHTGERAPDGEYLKAPEYTNVGPWFSNDVARAAGVEGVPGQAIIWGGLGHHTGVKTKVGAPKLELFADRIVDMARKLGITSEKGILQFRDKVLKGDEHSELDTGLAGILGRFA